jgi:hypothetical protein
MFECVTVLAKPKICVELTTAGFKLILIEVNEPPEVIAINP